MAESRPQAVEKQRAAAATSPLAEAGKWAKGRAWYHGGCQRPRERTLLPADARGLADACIFPLPAVGTRAGRTGQHQAAHPSLVAVAGRPWPGAGEETSRCDASGAFAVNAMPRTDTSRPWTEAEAAAMEESWNGARSVKQSSTDMSRRLHLPALDVNRAAAGLGAHAQMRGLVLFPLHVSEAGAANAIVGARHAHLHGLI